MRRCDDPAETCVTDHVAPHVDGRRITSTEGKQWLCLCPAHADDHRSLTISVGTRGQRIVWRCHAGCDPAEVRRAMLGAGIPSACLVWNPAPAPRGVRTEQERDVLAEIEKIITSGDAKSPQRMRLLIGMVLWDCDRHIAAERLGISWRTTYRIKVSPK